MEDLMEISVNGQQRCYPGPLSVAQLLQALGVNPRSVVVERNLMIVARDEIEKELLQEGDAIEIIRLVGGG
jgi:thiamine biosynthesis protein ThiS